MTHQDAARRWSRASGREIKALRDVVDHGTGRVDFTGDVEIDGQARAWRFFAFRGDVVFAFDAEDSDGDDDEIFERMASE